MTDNVEPSQLPEPDPADAPPPGVQPRAQKDNIDADSPDAKSVAPSDGTGVSGNVEPTQSREDRHSN